jgi:glycosyltransferase involved in cell wall biosynthesis
MHVAHLIDTLEIGGAQKLLVLFAGEAKLRGLKVTVISLTTKEANNAIITNLESLGVCVVLLSIYKLYDPTAIPKLLKVLRQGKVEILQTHLRHSNILGALAGMLAGIPVVATLHSTHVQPNGRLYRLRFLAEQYILRLGARRVIAVGRKIEEINRDRLVDKVMDIVPNPVQCFPSPSQEERRSIRQEIAGDQGKFLILTVGRLIPEKGLRDLLNAFAQVHEKHSSGMLIVVGDGEILGELKLQTASLGLVKDVRFVGARDDVPRLLSAGDVYVSSSYREGLSLAMLEAMAAGLPILATKVGDTEFLLNDGRGLMVSPRDVTALVNGMCYLIENPDRMKEIGCSARKFVEANYAPSQWMERLLGIYEQARNNAN